MRASVELAALMVIAAVSENATRVSLTTQREQNEKLVKQAEEHKELVEKEFSESMQHMKAEHNKTFQEAARIREEYAISARMTHETYDQMIQKVEGQQSSKVFGLQVDCLKKRANNLERELTEVMEKHEREMKAQEDLLCSVYKANIEREI